MVTGGAGNLGATLAKLFADAGHQVALSNSRGPASLSGLIEQIGPTVTAMTASTLQALSPNANVWLGLGVSAPGILRQHVQRMLAVPGKEELDLATSHLAAELLGDQRLDVGLVVVMARETAVGLLAGGGDGEADEDAGAGTGAARLA